MIIEDKERASKEFVLEYLNVANAYREILKHPDRKPINLFRSLKCLIICSAILIVFSVVMYILEDQTLMVALAFLFLAVIIFAWRVLKMNKKIVDDALSHDSKSQIKVDEKGVEIKKENNYNVMLPWENMFGICVLDESITFLPADQTGIIIAVPTKYKQELMEEVKKLGHSDLVLSFKK